MMLKSRAFTLVELLIAVAVAAVLLTLAAPSFRDMILMQRLRAVNAQLVTDLQLARSEAAARGSFVFFTLRSNAALSCYSTYLTEENLKRCNCTNPPGSACSAFPETVAREIRTVQVPRSGEVLLAMSPVPDGEDAQDDSVGFNPATGGIVSVVGDADRPALESFSIDVYIDSQRKLRTILNQTGRPTVCAPAGSKMDVSACPP